MNYFIFILASSIEYFGTFMFMFALFRFRIYSQMIINVLFVSFLMSQVSYFTRLNPEIGDLSTYIQFVLFILIVWILFRVPLFHSIIMNFAGIAAAIVIQGLIILLLSQSTGLTASEMLANIWIASSFQVLLAIFEIALARTIVIFNLGFDFVPTSPRSDVRIRGTNAVLMGIIIFAIVLAALMAYLFRTDPDIYVIGASIVFLLTLPIFIYFSIRKDFEDAA
ncbi:hypothetical protein BG53_00020 [Paenibacillus darwinianus]|uniref:Uncharacterized protein n=1 Tax=Paenibacillus darwinianus TaxID=1380763 RepID=A0A9W5W8W0_9BACL|nr:hypothetical protein [Paenibacillus darwinianus]EXX91568.1 hypothetical protein BG52_08775 [Paenibacillus darwinianus]EXX92626.1 hypothetical protein BG53_00020 [Paenibacillus darwinianus]EXX92659.1 hypothetical protein CH50_05770 [Paenibacillus darwinianus]